MLVRVVLLSFVGLWGVCPSVLAASNPIVLENQQPGTNAWQLLRPGFQVGNDVSKQIKGYASATSVNLGEPITFYVTVNPAQSYTIDIYRMGWYQGLGGRLMQHVGPIAGSQQPACPVTAATGLIACNWSPGYTLTVPATWTSGAYLALLTNSQNCQNYIVFVVRDDGRYTDLLYQESVTTYQAYNNYPNDNTTGKSLYTFNSFGANTSLGTKRALKVSYDRPYDTNGDGGFLNWEVYMIEWLEKSGYDVSYSTDIDTHANGSRLTSHKVFLSVGHDEYWSKQMRDSVEQARDLGVHLGFFGANAVYWQVRFEPSTLNAAPNRVQVCYKSQALDPVQGPTTTINWRDPFIGRPEQTLIGVMSTGQVSQHIDQTVPYVVTNSSNWVYAGTGLKDGTSIPEVVGYETDRYVNTYPLPAAVAGTYTLLSQSPYTDVNTGKPDYANSSIYQAPSGAWVFGAGSIGWAWSLTRTGYSDTRLQVASANVLNQFLNVPSNTPNPPSGLAATPVSASQINLAWTDNSSNETNFVLERSTSSTFSPITSFTLAANQVTYSDTGLSASTTYYYRVKAVNQTVSSLYSNVSSAATSAPNAPNAPTGMNGTPVSTTEIDLTWTDNSIDETNFVVERSLSSSFSSITSFTLPANQTSFNSTGLSPGTTYYFRVKALNQTVSSSYSNVFNATTLSVPNAPSGLTATAISTSQIDLAWTDNSANETNFIVERAPTSAFASITSFTLAANITSFSDTNLAVGITYYYRARATNASGSSGYSNVASAATQSAQGALYYLYDDQLRNSWSNWSYTGTVVFNSTVSPYSGADCVSFQPTGAWASLDFGYDAGSINTTGYTAISFALKATQANQKMGVFFNDGVAPFKKVALDNYGSPVQGAWTVYTIPLSDLAASNTSVDSLAIQDWSGTAGPLFYVDEVFFVGSAGAAPNAPSGLSATAVSSSQINLAWTDNSTNETNFIVERAPTSAFAAITSFTAAADTTSFSDTNLMAGTTYYYRVRATNASGSSGYSNVANAATQPASGGTVYYLYDDQLRNSWDNWSYTGTAVFNSTVSPYSGSYCISFQPTGAWASLDFGYNPGSINTTGYTAISFALKATQANQKIGVFFNDGVAPFKKVALDNYGSPVQGAWTVYTIPLSDLAASNTSVNSLAIQDWSGGAGPVFYVDQVLLVGN